MRDIGRSRGLIGAGLGHVEADASVGISSTGAIRFDDGRIPGPLSLSRFLTILMASIPGRLLTPRRNLTRLEARGDNLPGGVVSVNLVQADLRDRNGGRLGGNLVTRAIRFDDGRIRGPLSLSRFVTILTASIPGQLMSRRRNLTRLEARGDNLPGGVVSLKLVEADL